MTMENLHNIPPIWNWKNKDGRFTAKNGGNVLFRVANGERIFDNYGATVTLIYGDRVDIVGGTFSGKSYYRYDCQVRGNGISAHLNGNRVEINGDVAGWWD